MSLVFAIIFGAAVFSSPAEKSEDVRDFSEFYCAAQMVAAGLGQSLYDIGLQAEFISRVAAVHTFYNHPPFETLIFVPFTFFNYQLAYALWTLFSIGLMVIAAWLIESRSKVSLALFHYTRIPADLGLVLVIFLTFAPATTSLLTGQDSMLMLLIYTLVFVLLKRKAPFTGGCVLALGLFKFQLILPFALVLLARRKWSFLTGFTIAGGALVLLSTAVSGFQVLGTYPKFLLFDKTYQRFAGFQPEFMPNVRGIISLLFGRWMASSLVVLVVAALSLLILGLAARRWRDDQFDLSFSSAVLATLLTSYHLYNYDVTLLLLPMAVSCGELARQKRLLMSPRLLAVAMIVVLIPPLHRVLIQYSIYALIFVPLSVLLLIILRETESAQSNTSSGSEAAGTLAGGVTLR